jgi:hypothetical protein
MSLKMPDSDPDSDVEKVGINNGTRIRNNVAAIAG